MRRLIIGAALLSYPGDNYKEVRRKSFAVFWPDYIAID